MENLQEQINLKQADILSAKAYLYDTDWDVIKCTELKVELSQVVTQQRADARVLINQRQIEIAELQMQLEADFEEQQNSSHLC